LVRKIRNETCSIYLIWLPIAILKYGVRILYKLAFYSVIGLLLLHMFQRAYPDKEIGIDLDAEFNQKVESVVAIAGTMVKGAYSNFWQALEEFATTEAWRSLSKKMHV